MASQAIWQRREQKGSEHPLLALRLPARALWVFAAPAPGFFVAGKIDQGAAAAESATADTAVELPAAALCLADTDVSASRTDLNATSDAFVVDVAPHGQGDRQGDRLLV